MSVEKWVCCLASQSSQVFCVLPIYIDIYMYIYIHIYRCAYIENSCKPYTKGFSLLTKVLRMFALAGDKGVLKLSSYRQ